MVPVPSFMDVPEFGSSSSRIEPSPTIYSNGYLAGQVLPAENFNWFLNGLSDNGVTEQTSITSLVTEMVNFLAAFGVTPDAASFNQFVTTFNTRMALKANLAGPTFTGTVTIPAVPAPSAGGNPTTKTYVDAADSLLAPKASPALTGNPTAPTQSAGNNSTRLATTAFVAASFAPLASPVLTGNPTGPTQSDNDNSSSLATTAFVKNSNSGFSYVQDIGDWNMDSTGSITVNILATGFDDVVLPDISDICVTILRDDELRSYDLNFSGSYFITLFPGLGSNITLTRTSAGVFDSVDFNATSFNRGFIRITYVQ